MIRRAKKKKLIYAGIDVPAVDPRGKGYCKEQDLTTQLARVKALPFDGMTIEIRDPKHEWPRSALGTNLFSGFRHDYGTFAPVPALLRQLKQTPLTENFLPIATSYWYESGAKEKFDWFNYERWNIIEQNVQTYARLAKESGVIRGLIIDVEVYDKPASFGGEKEYAYNPFSLNHMFNLVRQQSREAYLARLKDCGRSFFANIEEQLPGAPILFYLGNGLALEKDNPYRSDMLPSFIDGMLEEIDRRKSKAYIVDGGEGAYKFRATSNYRDQRKHVYGPWKAQSKRPDLYQKKVRVGFGKWLDAGEGGVSVFNAGDSAKNYYSPQEWEDSLRDALKETDEYVWVWTGGQARFFPMTYDRKVNVPTAYQNATRRARDSVK
jgi:hypothetical protein